MYIIYKGFHFFQDSPSEDSVDGNTVSKQASKIQDSVDGNTVSKEASAIILRNPAVGSVRKSRIPSLNRSKTLVNIKDSTGKGNKPEYENVVLFRNSKSSEQLKKLEEVAQKEAHDELNPLPKSNPKSNTY